MPVLMYRAHRRFLLSQPPEFRKESAFDILHAALNAALDHIDAEEMVVEVLSRARQEIDSDIQSRSHKSNSHL